MSGRMVNLLLVIGLAWFLWPALKGLYYKHLSPPVPPGQSVAWRDDLANALSTSAESSRPVLLVFTAAWCPPCQVMKHEVWTDPAVRQLVESRYLPVLLDVDQPQSHPAARRYEVDSIPTILVLDSQGGVTRRASTMGVSATLGFLKLDS